MITLLKLSIIHSIDDILNALIDIGCHNFNVTNITEAESINYRDELTQQIVFERVPYSLKICFQIHNSEIYHFMTITPQQNDSGLITSLPKIFHNYTMCQMKMTEENNQILRDLSEFFHGSFVRLYDETRGSENLFRSFIPTKNLDISRNIFFLSIQHLPVKEKIKFINLIETKMSEVNNYISNQPITSFS